MNNKYNKLFIRLRHRFKVLQGFDCRWLDLLKRVHLSGTGEDFFSESQKLEIVKITSGVLREYKKTPRFFWCTCLPYLLRKQDQKFYQDYAILVKVDAINFELNGLDLKPNSAEVLEREYYKDVYLIAKTLIATEKY